MKTLNQVKPFKRGARTIDHRDLNALLREAKARSVTLETQASTLIRFVNVAAIEVSYGEPMIPGALGTYSTGLTGEYAALRSPSGVTLVGDAQSIVYINRSGDIALNGHGVAEFIGATYLVKVDQACNLFDAVGTHQDGTTFYKDVPGLRVLLYYGNKYSDGNLWALCCRDTMPSVLIRATDDPSADMNTFKTTTEDNVLGDKEFEGFVPG